MLNAYFESVQMFTLLPAANSRTLHSTVSSAFCAEVSMGSGAASVILVGVTMTEQAFYFPSYTKQLPSVMNSGSPVGASCSSGQLT